MNKEDELSEMEKMCLDCIENYERNGMSFQVVFAKELEKRFPEKQYFLDMMQLKKPEDFYNWLKFEIKYNKND